MLAARLRNAAPFLAAGFVAGSAALLVHQTHFSTGTGKIITFVLVLNILALRASSPRSVLEVNQPLSDLASDRKRTKKD